jgi:hypothetical protein
MTLAFEISQSTSCHEFLLTALHTRLRLILGSFWWLLADNTAHVLMGLQVSSQPMLALVGSPKMLRTSLCWITAVAD